ncbi:3-phosphoshikimate 1-carboxyvinyltransferase [Hazenella coriacea]|uniref:3-phosphoshikimate 1-carboxyvinyltransferase n=1 Tax=Hazenella coriacea TaxID=1179467 RepID=A0A4R3L1E2_9BACL|nr:3-phosphoshikimate 1-carboxyvinyltransferase [Hazenella coriacea]TCS93381.1 3-phosphoshikimate 1-carboxyvinyltransferase [Hazenella coriacea]
MSQIQVSRSKPFQKTFRVPGDKSISHRSIMLGALAEGITTVKGFLTGADCLNTMTCFQQMGVHMERPEETTLYIYGKGMEGLKELKQPLDVGNSGTTIRLMAGLLSAAPFFSVLIGDDSISRRPMSRIVEPLRLMGAKIDGRQGGKYTPLVIHGSPLQGITYQTPVASAQVKSALMLAGLFAEGQTILKEPSLSRDHTERLLPAFGVEVNRDDDCMVSIQGKQSLSATTVQVPGDFSSAAFLLATACMVPGSRVTVEGVGLNPTRIGLIEALSQMGADIEWEITDFSCHEPMGRVTIVAEELVGSIFGGEIIPRMIDEIPILAVIATQAKGRTIIRDAEELKVKETNRIRAITQELRKLGAQIEETEDGLMIEGPTPLQGGVCQSHGDHRIGMALAVAGLASKDGVRVEQAEAIQISFPGFEEMILRL